MLKRSVLLMVLFAVGTVAAPNLAGAATCGWATSGHTKTVKTFAKNDDPVRMSATTVDHKKYDQYTVNLPAGEHYLVVESAADVDLIVCKGDQEVCKSTNDVLTPDSCLVDGLEPDVGPPLSGKATFRIEVLHCLTGDCQRADVNAPIPYVITLATV